MQSLQEIFSRTQELRKKQKDLKAAFRDARSVSMEYQDIEEKLTTLKERKKQVENTIKVLFASELTKIDDI